MPIFCITYSTTLPLVPMMATSLSADAIETLLLVLRSQQSHSRVITTAKSVEFLGIKFIKAFSLPTSATEAKPNLRVFVQIMVKTMTLQNARTVMPEFFLAQALKTLQEDVKIPFPMDNVQWQIAEPYAVPGPHVVSLKESPKRALLETTKRYDIFVNDEPFGELYFNIKGYVGSLPLPGGTSLDIGEKGLSAFKKEVAQINKGSRFMASFYKDLRDRYAAKKIEAKLATAEPLLEVLICPACGRQHDTNDGHVAEGDFCPAEDCPSNDFKKLTFLTNGMEHSSIMSQISAHVELCLFKERYGFLSSTYSIGLEVNDKSVDISDI
jgi:hypothetical protein